MEPWQYKHTAGNRDLKRLLKQYGFRSGQELMYSLSNGNKSRAVHNFLANYCDDFVRLANKHQMAPTPRRRFLEWLSGAVTRKHTRERVKIIQRTVGKGASYLLFYAGLMNTLTRVAGAKDSPELDNVRLACARALRSKLAAGRIDDDALSQLQDSVDVFLTSSDADGEYRYFAFMYLEMFRYSE